jgi:ABC-type cobalamin transport system permease subunit
VPGLFFLGQALGQAAVVNRHFSIALALVWGLIGLVNPRIQALELQTAKMNRLLTTMAVAAEFALLPPDQAAVKNVAWLQGTTLKNGSPA